MSEEENKNAKDIAKLRHDVDVLKQKVHQHAGKQIYKTDFAKHIEDLDKEIKRKSSQRIKAAKVNAFTIDQKVKLSSGIISLHAIAPGTIKFIACKLATSSIKQCNKADCKHNSKDYIWVQWASGKNYSYHFTQLSLMIEDDLKPKIGKELSGRIGEWIYDADKKTWKRDGSDKEYSNEEFEDVVYYETHPYAKDEGVDFLKALKRDQEAEKEIEAIK